MRYVLALVAPAILLAGCATDSRHQVPLDPYAADMLLGNSSPGMTVIHPPLGSYVNGIGDPCFVFSLVQEDPRFGARRDGEGSVCLASGGPWYIESRSMGVWQPYSSAPHPLPPVFPAPMGTWSPVTR